MALRSDCRTLGRPEHKATGTVFGRDDGGPENRCCRGPASTREGSRRSAFGQGGRGTTTRARDSTPSTRESDGVPDGEGRQARSSRETRKVGNASEGGS